MQNFKILIIVLVGIVFVETCYIVLQNTVLKPKTAIEIIKSRKSVRHYVENKDVRIKIFLKCLRQQWQHLQQLINSLGNYCS